MTPEEMRDRLSELGIESEFVSYPNKKAIGVKWQIDGIVWKYDWYGSTPQALSTCMHYSPEQAIDATVTTEPDEATMLKLHSRMNAALLDMNEELLAYHSQDRENASSKKLIDSVIAAHQIIEDAAAVGVGTCHTVGMSALGNPPFNKSGLSTNSMECGCSECGAPWSTMGIFRGNTIKHNFKACPICGRRIIKEATE